MGTTDHACDLHSRWRKISFVRNDPKSSLKRNLRIISNDDNTAFLITTNGRTRTVTSSLTIGNAGYGNYTFDPNFTYELCGTPENKIGGKLYIRLEDEKCVWIQNPAVNLDGYEHTASNIFNLPDGSVQPIDQWWNHGEELVFVINVSLFDDPSFSSACAELPLLTELGDEPIFGKLSDGTWLMFDPRLDLETNTPGSPIADGGKGKFLAAGGDLRCSNVPRTFLNDNECQISSNACKANTKTQVDILLENSTISDLNNLTNRYVYAIKGLLVNYDGIALKHPCTPGLRSRWEPKEISDCNPTELYSLTNETLFDLISKNRDRNPYIKDLHFPWKGRSCNISDTEPDIEIEIDGECWKRVHDHHLSIFDVSRLFPV